MKDTIPTLSLVMYGGESWSFFFIWAKTIIIETNILAYGGKLNAKLSKVQNMSNEFMQ